MTQRKLNFETPTTKEFDAELLSSTVAAESDAAKRKADNDKFIKAFKKQAGAKTQTVLPTAITAHNEWAVRQGWSICDAMHWRSLCEHAKLAQDEIEGDSTLELLLGTIEIAARCDSHPCGLIAHAREAFGAKTWDIDTLHMMMDQLIPEDEQDQVDVDDDDDDGDSNGKKRKFANDVTPGLPMD